MTVSATFQSILKQSFAKESKQNEIKGEILKPISCNQSTDSSEK